jgi:hypothetical protein
MAACQKALSVSTNIVSMSDKLDVIESGYLVDDAAGPVRELLFEDEMNPEIIASSLEIAERENEMPARQVIDRAGQLELSTIHTSARTVSCFPDVLNNWKGWSGDDTEEILEMADLPEDELPEPVRAYQSEMRAELPDCIPLVRATDGSSNYTPDDRSLQSWTSRVGHAFLHGSHVHYTVVRPSDVFMCAMYGEPSIGQDEFTLKYWSVESTHKASIQTQLELYLKMSQQLNS